MSRVQVPAIPAMAVPAAGWCGCSRARFCKGEERREVARGNPEGLKAAGFEDDPSKGGREPLRLEVDLVPGWAPGRSMKPPRPAVMKLVIPRRWGKPLCACAATVSVIGFGSQIPGNVRV